MIQDPKDNNQKVKPLCSAVILCKQRSKDFPELLKSWPKDFSLDDETQLFKSSLRLTQIHASNEISFFNTTSYACISLNFKDNHQLYSLCVLSEYPLYDFYSYMFHVACMDFQHEYPEKSPANKFNYICHAIQGFPAFDPTELIQTTSMKTTSTDVPPSIKVTVNLATISFIYIFTHGSFTYRKFDPTKYFSVKECFSIWKCLFTNQPILIVTNDHTDGSNAVLAAASLLSPLPFTDEMCLWLTDTDPRFVDIINNESKIKICATNSIMLPSATEYFKLVITLNSKRYMPNPTIVKQIHSKMNKVMRFTGYALDKYRKENDLYYDLIEGDICTEKFIHVLNSFKEADLPKEHDFQEWQKTQSFKDWRKNRTISKDFRDQLLNVDPKTIFDGKSTDEVSKIYSTIKHLIQNNSADIHVVAVLRNQKKIAKRILTNKAR